MFSKLDWVQIALLVLISSGAFLLCDGTSFDDCDEHPCASGGCVLYSQLCDGKKDCYDSSDEDRVLCDNHTCDGEQVNCLTQRLEGIYPACIGSIYRCDGNVDCKVGADDEEDCPTWGDCDVSFQHRCSDGKCIHKLKVCDINVNCPDAEEERQCKYQVSIMGYTPPLKLEETLTLKCSLGVDHTSEYHINYLWTFLAPKTSWWTVLQETSDTLVIRNVNLDHSGDYFCELHIPELQSKGNATLSIVVEIKVQISGYKGHIDEGGAVNLTCIPSPSVAESATYQWLHRLNNSVNFTTTAYTSSSVAIDGISPAQGGQYKCVVKVASGMGYDVVNVVVKPTVPNVYITGYKSYITIGELLRLTCVVDNKISDDLTWTYKWYYKPSQVQQNWTYLTTRQKIVAIDMTEADSGLYKCLVTTQFHRAAAILEVLVKNVPGENANVVEQGQQGGEERAALSDSCVPRVSGILMFLQFVFLCVRRIQRTCL